MNRQLRAGDTDEHVIEQRSEVKSKWGRVDGFLERYGRILLTLAVALSTWFLSHVVAPLNQIPKVVEHQSWQDSVEVSKQSKTDSVLTVIDRKLTQAEMDRSRMVDILATLAALQCEQFTPREKQTSILCRRITLGGL